MKEQPSNPCEKVSFILTYDQLEAAYNIYREQFISCDFIRRSMERLEERIGLCNLPYETLRDDPTSSLLSVLSMLIKEIVFTGLDGFTRYSSRYSLSINQTVESHAIFFAWQKIYS